MTETVWNNHSHKSAVGYSGALGSFSEPDSFERVECLQWGADKPVEAKRGQEVVLTLGLLFTPPTTQAISCTATREIPENAAIAVSQDS